jgi:class 3 adenylate cyclase/tetratricopeptide (TPR) repeat protein
MSEERRLVTVLFADVVGSTSLGDAMDPEDLRRLLGRFYAIASDVVAEHGGTLEKFIGDAAMAIFGLPHAHDDDAGRALDAALALCDRLRDEPALEERLPIRIGLNTGEVIASRDRERSDFIVTGDPVNIAARLQQAAEPWQILASARTASADRGAHEFGPVLDLDLKGKNALVRARVLLGQSTAAAPRAPLIGREADLAQLELVARRAFSERRPYMVSLIAPAGTGKSRLVEEFIVRLGDVASDAQVAIAQCLPYGQRLTYWPMRALLASIVSLPDQAGPEATRQAIRDWLTGAGAERPEEDAELLAATIGAGDADVQDRARLFGAWREVVELAAARRPMLLLIEDLHWSSDSLLDLIEFILQPRADTPIVMLALARPELLERRPSWGGGRRNHFSIALEPLDEGSIGELVRGLLEGAAPELVPLVASRSEGNPFYAGEIVRSLLERGIDLSDSGAVAEAAARLPDTVHATVLARLDTLQPGVRRVLQLGSVFGRSFTTDGVASIEGDRDHHATAIEQLVDRELLRPGGRGEFTFRHIIIRDVAYGTLTRSERAGLHAAAGRWVEARAADREDELAELVAFHYREAAVLSASVADTDQSIRASAVKWLRRAADVAAGARGVTEAAGHLRAAIELATGPDQAVLYQRLGRVLGSGDASVQAYSRAWQLGREHGLSADFLLENLGRHLMVICRFTASVGRQPSEREIDELIALGESWLAAAAPRARATFLISLGFKPFWLRQSGERPPTEDDLSSARANVEQGLAVAEEIDDAQLISAALDALSGITQATDWRTTVALSRRRMALADRLDLEERLDALQMLAWASAQLGELEEAVAAADAAMAQLQPGQNMAFALAGASWSGYCRALQGEWDAAEASVDDLRRRWLDAGRPAAAYALQGLLSGLDWARNRGQDAPFDRWHSVAEEIVSSFPVAHPVAAMSAVLSLEMDGVTEVARRHERYPDRAHYVEHALALCADRHHPVPVAVLEEILRRSERSGLRVLWAQARRVKGIVTDDAEELSAALGAFEGMGARRYAARIRVELGSLTGDAELLKAGREQLDVLGEGALLRMYAERASEVPPDAAD